MVTRKSPRYRVTADGSHRCVIRWSNGHERSYWAPEKGGYVYDVTKRPGTSGQQVMENGAVRGATLCWSGRGELADVMRRWARRMAQDPMHDVQLETWAGDR